MRQIMAIFILALTLTGCSTWVYSEIDQHSAFDAWWSRLSSQEKQRYEENEQEGRLAFSQWYESQLPEERAHYEQLDEQREKSSLLFGGQMQQGVVQEQFVIP